MKSSGRWLPIVYFSIFFISNPLFALTIEAMGKDSKYVENTEVLYFYPRTLSINFKPDTGTFDRSCFTVKGKMGVYSSGWGKIDIEGWGDHSLKYNTTGRYGYELTVTNQCGFVVSGNLEAQFKRSGGKGKLNRHYMRLDSRLCKADVNTQPVFAVIYPRDDISPIKITTNVAGNGSLSFIPNQQENGKGILSNDNKQKLSYSMINIPWDNTLKGWAGKIDEYLLKIDKVNSSTSAGNYTGTMQVRILCL
ncbi:hypothetical protein [Providencia rettgeri]|uniref:hypothetical protein n=1 Tax=Providencia rettgeri TaxID=587 RepID=UPI001419A37B|nr:hypothetical protein [Providencia rettgeri]NIH03986.1 hypothetical protein [Providencia rettgeri]